MSRLICLFLRSDVDWSRLSEETYLEQATFNRSVMRISEARKQGLLERIQIWNQTFSLSYFAYRQELRAIAKTNHNRLRNLDWVIRNRHQWSLILHSPEPVVLLPVDEDDWFCPDLPDLLRLQAQEHVDLFTWDDAVFSPLRRRPVRGAAYPRIVFRHPRPDGVWTNGYAVTSDGLRRCPPDAQDDLLNRHARVLAMFQKHAPEYQTVSLPGVLSMTHKSPASFMKLLEVQSEADLRAQIPSLEHPTREIPAPVAWATNAIRQVDDLNRNLVRSLRTRSGRPPMVRPQPLQQNTRLTQTDVINRVIAHFGSTSYLEIGCGDDRNFAAVAAPSKVGVDPQRGGTLCMTSDEFFQINQAQFDLVFIDGLHLQEQVLRDVENSLRALRSGGCVLIHDCLPVEKVHQERIRQTAMWFGDVWKAVVRLRIRPDLDLAVLDGCCGLGIVFPRPNSDPLRELPELNWETYVQYKQRLLRVLDVKGFNRFLTNGT